MAKATVANLSKMQKDLATMVEKISTMRSTLTSMASNPKGGDMELARLMKIARGNLDDVGTILLTAADALKEPVAILTRRKRPKR